MRASRSPRSRAAAHRPRPRAACRGARRCPRTRSGRRTSTSSAPASRSTAIASSRARTTSASMSRGNCSAARTAMRMPRTSIALRSRRSRDGRRRVRPSAIAAVSNAQSSTVCASGPMVSSSVDSGTAPCRLTRPNVVLRPVMPAQRCRNAHRAAGVRPDRRRRESCRHRDRGSARRAAGHAMRREVPRVPRRAHRLVASPAAERELDQMRLAERNHARRRRAARRTSPCDRRCGRATSAIRRSSAGPSISSRSLSAIGKPCSGPRCDVRCALEVRRVARACAHRRDRRRRTRAACRRARDAGEAVVDDLARRRLAPGEQGGELAERAPCKVGGHVPTRA